MLVAACCAYRLARFNASEESETAQTFEGVPAPVLALLTLMPVYLYLLEFDFVSQSPAMISMYLIGCGFLAVSQVPTLSLKSLKVSQSYGFLVVPIFTLLIASLLIYPWETLTMLSLTYLVALPFTRVNTRGPSLVRLPSGRVFSSIYSLAIKSWSPKRCDLPSLWDSTTIKIPHFQNAIKF